MMLMVTGVALMALLAMVLVMLPAPARRVQHAEVRQSANVAAYREQLAELEADRAEGLVDDATFGALKLELDRSLLEDAAPAMAPRHSEAAGHWGLALAAMLMLALAGGLYAHFGQWADVEIAQTVEDLQGRFERGLDTGPQADALVAQLQARVEQTPDNDDLWILLAQTSAVLGHHEQSLRAYEQLARKYPQDANALAYAAQAAYTAAGNTMTTAASDYLQRALGLDPEQPTALALKGMDAFEHQRYQEAIDAWRGMLASSEPGSDQATMVRAGIRKAQQALGLKPATDGAVKLHITVGSALQVPPDSVVFIGARESGRKGRPMVAARLTAKELPVDLVLDQRYALSASRVPEVGDRLDVFARISRTGSPEAAAGDLEARLDGVLVEAAPALNTLDIARVLSADDIAAAAGASAVRARVSLAAGVQARPDEKVFVVVRAVKGPPMPLAVKVLTASMLPTEVTLSDADAMSPMARISGAERVVVSAKLSRSGRADPGPGDVLSESVEREPGASGVIPLVIERVQP